MIEATEADIGRRVVYDARPTIKELAKGKLVGIDGDCALVLFDHAVKNYPENPPVLRVGSNLKWGDQP